MFIKELKEYLGQVDVADLDDLDGVLVAFDYDELRVHAQGLQSLVKTLTLRRIHCRVVIRVDQQRRGRVLVHIV